MKRIKMRPIRIRHPRERASAIIVDGGWWANVPEVTPDNDTLRAYTEYFRGEPDPEAAALEVVQRSFDSGFVRGLRLAIGRLAQDYALLHPHLVVPRPTSLKLRGVGRRVREYQLEGFNPAALQGMYVPHDNPGRRGKPFATEALRRMADATERRR